MWVSMIALQPVRHYNLKKYYNMEGLPGTIKFTLLGIFLGICGVTIGSEFLAYTGFGLAGLSLLSFIFYECWWNGSEPNQKN